MANLRTDVTVDAAAVAGAGGAGVTGGAISMKLQMMRGSFLPADAGPAMDADVWSGLPEDMVWEVVQRVSAGASQFRLQSVSRAWHRDLTSAHSRTRAATAAAPAGREQQQERRVVARACNTSSCCSNCSSVGEKLKLVDTDLASFVPSSFWSSASELCTKSYAVVAAAHGLVCISNSENHLQPAPHGGEHKYCVVNPLTRTCKVLPPVPFQPDRWLALTPDAITILGWLGHEVCARGVLVATYDLQADSGEWDSAAYRVQHEFPTSGTPAVALCARETFLFYDGRLYVLAPGRPDHDGPTLVEVGDLEEPSLELLGVDASLYYGPGGESLEPLFTGLEEHQGALFFFMRLNTKRDGEVDMLMCVWRLARESLQWEPVARLDVAELEGLTGLEGLDYEGACQVWPPCGVQESLWFCVEVGVNRCFWLDFNLDTREWKLAHDSKQGLLHHGASSVDDQQCHAELTVSDWNFVFSMPFELRPDLFL